MKSKYINSAVLILIVILQITWSENCSQLLDKLPVWALGMIDASLMPSYALLWESVDKRTCHTLAFVGMLAKKLLAYVGILGK